MTLPVIVVSPSELDAARQCPLKHKLAYVERWTREQSSEMHPLALGTLWHSVMEAHRRALIKPGGSLYDAKVAAGNVILTVIDPEVAELLTWMYTGYVEYYGRDAQWKILDVEMSGEIDLPAPAGWPDPEVQFRLKFKLDLLVEWQGRFWVVDEKSCKDLPRKTDLAFDDQFGLYYWAATQLGYPVFGAIHSATRKTRLKTKVPPLEERFLRTPISHGRHELRRIATEAWQTAYNAYTNIARVNEARRHGSDVEVERRPNPQTCNWRCDFTEPCLAGRKGVNMRDYLHRKGYRVDHSRH